MPNDFPLRVASSVIRGHSLKLCIHQCNIVSREYYSFLHLVPFWTALPNKVVSSHSISRFKFSIRDVDLSGSVERGILEKN